MKILLIATATGPIGSGIGGGTEHSLKTLIHGLQKNNHYVEVIATVGSKKCNCKIIEVSGKPQPLWQQLNRDAQIVQPPDGLLTAMCTKAWDIQEEFDAIINFGYDWLPMWLTRCFKTPLLHLISMGSLIDVMDHAICEVAQLWPNQIAFQSDSAMNSFDLHYNAPLNSDTF
jgi:UDP-glucose:tetrahydrobiopterin glucosyltransferase